MVMMTLWLVLGLALASGMIAVWHLAEHTRAREAMQAELSWVRYQDAQLREIENEIKEIDQARQALSLRVEQGKPPPACGCVYDHPGWRPEVCALPVLHVGVHENKAKNIHWYNGVLFPFSNPFERSKT